MLMRHWLHICFLAVALVQVALLSGGFAQQVHPEGKRKMLVEVRPVYPVLARRANLSGVVRLRVTVSAAGYPVSTEQLGGSPVLVKAATEAVSRAKWEPTPAETKETLQIRFAVDQK